MVIAIRHESHTAISSREWQDWTSEQQVRELIRTLGWTVVDPVYMQAILQRYEQVKSGKKVWISFALPNGVLLTIFRSPTS